MGLAGTLAQAGIRRPDVTIRAAAAAGLELAAACVVLMGESGGGQMIWGSDGARATPPQETLGIYEFGGPVTRDNYLRYRAAVKDRRIKRQGVGDVQLTSAEFQDRGDQLGGCWDPYANQLAGFIGLAERIRAHGVRDGFRRYNGSGDAAEAYADRAMKALASWRDLIGEQPTPPAVPAATPILEEEPMAPIVINPGPDGVFRAAAMVEAGATSLVAERAWITFGSTWGATRFRVCALDPAGRVMPGTFEGEVPSNGRRVLEIPSGAVMATIEGHRLTPSSVPAAALVVLPKR